MRVYRHFGGASSSRTNMSTQNLALLIATSLLLTACPVPNDMDPEASTGSIPGTDGASSTTLPTTSGSENESTSDDSTGEYGSTGGFITNPSTGEDSTTGDSSTGEDSTTGDSSTGEGSTSTGGIPGFDCFELDQLINDPTALDVQCAKHPWVDNQCGVPNPTPVPSCQDIILILEGFEGCNDINWCNYKACADARAEDPCGPRPEECDPIAQCLEGWEPTPAVDPSKPSMSEIFAGFVWDFFGKRG